MEEKFTNKEIVILFRNIAAAYLLQNVNRFRIIAYENAATSVEHLNRELRDIWKEGKLTEVPGIGTSIASHLNEYFSTGHSKQFDEALKGIPVTVYALMKVPSIGPKKAYKLVNELKLVNEKTIYEDLKKAAEDNRIAELETFGKKSQDDIIEALELFKKRKSKEKRMPLPYAASLADEIIEYLKKNKQVKRADVLGSLRRMVSTIGDVDIAVEADEKHAKEIVNYFIAYPKKLSLDNSGDKKASIIVPPYIRVDMRVQDKKTYGSMLQYFTGSKAHNIKLREYVIKKGLSLNEYGMKGKGKNTEFRNEESLYNFVGLQYIPPEVREGSNEIDLAKKNKIPTLVDLHDMKGDLHLHSSYDLKPSHDLGRNTYVEILEKAKELGYEYVGFADHNPKKIRLTDAEVLHILEKRREHIDKTCKGKSVKYFVGLEVDIQPDGNLALPQKAIDYLDYMVVSVHSSFGMNVIEMTKRVMKALSHQKVKILGHPTGRLLDQREGFELDWPVIFAECKKRNIALEINAWPERLDLPDTLVRQAKDAGNQFIIDTDAHATYQMDNMKYGVSVARRGWCTKDAIMNTRTYEEMRKWML